MTLTINIPINGQVIGWGIHGSSAFLLSEEASSGETPCAWGWGWVKAWDLKLWFESHALLPAQAVQEWMCGALGEFTQNADSWGFFLEIPSQEFGERADTWCLQRSFQRIVIREQLCSYLPQCVPDQQQENPRKAVSSPALDCKEESLNSCIEVHSTYWDIRTEPTGNNITSYPAPAP